MLDLVLEAALGYARAIGTLLMYELASLNKKCDLSMVDIKMEDLVRRIVALVDEGIRDCEMVRMMGVEERERSQRWNERAVLETRHFKGEIETLRTQLSDKRRARQDLARSHAELRTLTNGLVQTVGDLRDDLARLTRWVSNGLPRARPLVDSARMAAEPIHMLIEHECQDYGFLTDFSLLFCLTQFTFVNFSYPYDTNLFSYLPFTLKLCFHSDRSHHEEGVSG